MGRATRFMMLIGAAAALGACTASQTASIVSNPNGVTVAVNGQRIGTTPTAFDFEFPEDYSRYTVSGSKDGYYGASFVVTQNWLETAGKIVFNLESQNLPVDIASEPSGVTVKIGNEEIGQTPIKHVLNFANRSSSYAIVGSREGYHDDAVVVTEKSLKQSGKVELTLELQDRPLLIISEPGLATVTIGERKTGDQDVGRTPVEYTFNFADREKRYKVVISKPGYFDQKFFVTERDLINSGSGEIEVVLEEDPAWTSTSESEATNRWLRIPVNPAIDHAGAWQKVIDSVTTVYNSLEQLDQVSGYIRSAPRLRQYDKGPEGPYYVRTQFIGSISSLDPLIYKIKLIAKKRLEVESNENWKNFERVFAEDAQLVEELLNRLGLK